MPGFPKPGTFCPGLLPLLKAGIFLCSYNYLNSVEFSDSCGESAWIRPANKNFRVCRELYGRAGVSLMAARFSRCSVLSLPGQNLLSSGFPKPDALCPCAFPLFGVGAFFIYLNQSFADLSASGLIVVFSFNHSSNLRWTSSMPMPRRAEKSCTVGKWGGRGASPPV